MRCQMLVALACVATMAGCSSGDVGCPPGSGASMVAVFASAPPMTVLGEALVADGWNVTEGATELAATRTFAALGNTSDEQAAHLALVQPAGSPNVTEARLGSHVVARDAASAEERLAPAARRVLDVLAPALGAPQTLRYEGC